jgi:hypothetical protein
MVIFHSYVKLPEGKLVMISLILFVHMNDDYSKETMIPPPPFLAGLFVLGEPKTPKKAGWFSWKIRK